MGTEPFGCCVVSGMSKVKFPKQHPITNVMNKQVLIQETTLLLDELPEETSWDEVMYKIYVRQKIEKGLADCESGKVLTTEQVKQYFAQKS
jgi:hypothetical protein